MAKDTTVGAKVGIAFDPSTVDKATAEMVAAVLGMTEKAQRETLRAAKRADPQRMIDALRGMTKEQLQQGIYRRAEEESQALDKAAAKEEAKEKERHEKKVTGMLERDRKMRNRVQQEQDRASQYEKNTAEQNINKILDRDRRDTNRYQNNLDKEAERDARRKQAAADKKIKAAKTAQERETAEIEANVTKALERDRKMTNRLATHSDQEAARLKQQQETQSRSRSQQRSQFISGAMMGTGLFAVGEGGKLLSTLGLGNTPIGSAYAGGAAGMSAGMSMGMAGGPAGVAVGGIGGAILGTGFGMLTGSLKMVMDLLKSGVEAAIGIVEQGAREIVKLGMEYEKTLIKFEILTGSKDVGSKLYGGIEKMATTTPYTAGRISSNVEMLLGYGVKPDASLTAARRLGDIGGGDSTRYERLALAYGQVVSQGRLMGQELRQFSEAGVGAADFAQTYGKSVFQLKKDMEAGIVPAQVMQDTIKRLTEEGGRFYGMNERVSKSVEGRWTALVGTLEMIGRRLGTGLFDRFGVAGGLGKGVGMLEGMVGGPQMDKALDWLEKWGKKALEFGSNLMDAVVPALSLIKDMGAVIGKSLFGEAFDMSKEAWVSFEQTLLSGVKKVALVIVDLGKVVLSVLPLMIDMMALSATLLQGGKFTLGGAAAGGLAGLAFGGPLGGMFGAGAGALAGRAIFGMVNPGADEAILGPAHAAKDIIRGINLDPIRKGIEGLDTSGGVQPSLLGGRFSLNTDDMQKNIRREINKSVAYGVSQKKDYSELGQSGRGVSLFDKDLVDLSPAERVARQRYVDEQDARTKREGFLGRMGGWLQEQDRFMGPGQSMAGAISNINIPGLGKIPGPIKGIVDMVSGLFGGKGGAEEKGLNLTADADVQKMFDDLTKALKEGISPWEKFAQAMDTIAAGKDTRGGMGPDFMGPVIPGKNDLLTTQMANREKYEAFMKLRGSMGGPLPLPGTVGKDTQEAIKLINEASQSDRTQLTQEEILETLKDGKEAQDRIDENVRIVASAIGENAFVLKPRGP